MSKPAPHALRIRPAQASDGPALVRVYMASRQAFLPYAPLAHDEEDIGRWMGDLVARGDCVTLASLGDAIVGLLVVTVHESASWIEQLFLAPGHTGAGIGARLLAHALRESPRSLPIRLYTFQANQGARKFYERAGFKPIAMGDGTNNEEGCPDILYERAVGLPGDLSGARS